MATEKQASDPGRDAMGNVEDITRDIRDRAQSLAGDVSTRARQAYGEAGGWLRDNYGKTLAVVGVLAAVGLVGYLLASRDRERWARDQRY